MFCVINLLYFILYNQEVKSTDVMNRDKEEFLDILERYQGILHKVNLVYFRNSADREDNFQEMVYQLYRSYPELKKKESIGSWIYKVAINTSITKLKKDSQLKYKEEIPEPAFDTDMEKKMEEAESSLLLLKAIHELNDTNKAIILLYLEEKSYDEIAEITGLSKNNVGVRINRTKKILKEKLKFLNDGKR